MTAGTKNRQEQLLQDTGHAARTRSSRFSVRSGLAAMCLLAAVACLWTATGIPSPFRGSAVATAEAALEGSPLPDAVHEDAALRKMLLQASVDSAAFGIAGVLDGLPDEKSRREALAGALDALTFELEAPVYFTAWEQTRLLHSPLTPDTDGMNFADALDGRGMAFVQALNDCLNAGGGFVQVVLPRQDFGKRAAPDRKAASPSASGPASTRPGETSLAKPSYLYTPSNSAARKPEEAQIIYTRPIPNSNWHISAFMAAPEGSAASGPSCVSTSREGRSDTLWQSALLADKDAKALTESLLRQGLGISGLSFLGMAGVLAFARRREE